MLGRRAREVDFDLVAGDGDGGADDELALERLEHVGRLVAAVRELGDRRAHAPLRVGEELVHRREDQLAAAPLAELGEPPLREPVRRELRAEVAAALVGVAHVGEQDRRDLVGEAHGRDDEPLLVDLGRVGRQARRLGAADVGVVGAADGEAALRARDERDVGEVRAAGEGVVEDEDLAGRGSRARTAATASGIAPRWTGMCSAWAIMRPSGAKSAVEQSRRSLMLAEKAERTSTAPISSATARSALPRTWS